jgi:hypothetical protein
MPVRRLIRERYAAVHGASPEVDYPHHCTILDGGDAIATLGYRHGDEGRLFVETYLDAPVEVVLSERLGRPIDRAAIVEIGAHASRRPAATMALWLRAANELQDQAEIAVAVLTGPIRDMFGRIGLPIQIVEKSDPGRVAAGSGQWGRYYESDPLVCAGEIAAGHACLTQWTRERRI